MKNLGALLVMGLVFVIVLVILLGWFDPGGQELRAEKNAIAEKHARELAPFWLVAKKVGIVSLGVIFATGAAVALVIGVSALWAVPDIKRRARILSWLIKPTHHALYPTPARPDGFGHFTVDTPVNERLAQAIAALTNGHVERLGGAGQVVKQLTNPKDENHPFGEEPLPEYRPEQVIQPDPQNRPDTLIVGQKGSGKTNTLRWLIDAYRKAMPDAEFLVLSPVASNWAGLLPVVSDTEDIRQAVLALREELTTRDKSLTEAGVRDIHRAAEGPRRVVVVVDEAETVADEIKLTSQAQYKEFTGTLRIVINTARNFGFCIIFGTQTARADVLDPAFMRNASTLLMMRMDAATAARFNQYDKAVVAALPTLAKGRAYCPQAGGYVQFPLVETIRKPRISTIYTPAPQLTAGEQPLQLPADAEADGLGEDDQPDTHGEYARQQPLQRLSADTPLQPARRGATGQLQRLPKRLPSPEEAIAMRALYQRNHSKTAVCMAFYGYKDDDIWHYVMLALEGKI